MEKCETCDDVFDKKKKGKDKIKCKICNLMYHPDCLNMSADDFKLITKMKNLSWFCDKCIPIRDNHFGDVLKSLQKVLDKCENTEKIMKEKCENLAKIEIIIETQNKKIESQTASINELRTNVSTLSKKLGANGKRLYSDIVCDKTPLSSATSTRASKKPKENASKKENDPILVIKSKTGANTTELSKIVTQTVNPASDPVHDLRQTAKGNLILKCNNHEVLEQVKQKINEKAGEFVDANEPKTIQPTLNIIGFSIADIMMMYDDSLDDNAALIKALYKQNNTIFTDTSQVDVTDIRERSNGTCTARITTDTSTFNKIMSSQRVKLGWKNCIVYEYINVGRCYKCQAYGHSAADCKSETDICGKCSDQHKTQECTSQTMLCINCKKVKEEFNIDVPIDHCVWSSECQCMQRKIKQRKQFIRYSK